MTFDYLKTHQADIAVASEILLNTQALAPMFVLHTPSEKLVHVMEWRTSRERDKAMATVRASILAYNCFAVSHMFIGFEHTWLQHQDESSEQFEARVAAARSGGHTPGQEALSVMLSFRRSKLVSTLLTVRTMRRQPDGTLGGLSEPVMARGRGEGAPLYLLPVHPPGPTVAGFFRRMLERQEQPHAGLANIHHTPGHA